MRVLLDECVPRRLTARISGHDVTTVPKAGWMGIKNGRLLKLAEGSFDALITVDRNLGFQQNFTGLQIAILVLAAKSNRFEDLLPLVPGILSVLAEIRSAFRGLPFAANDPFHRLHRAA